MFKTSTYTTLALALFSTPLRAAHLDYFDLSLEQLMAVKVKVVSKTSEQISAAPGIVSVITHNDIIRYGANNLLEILQRFPGYVPVSDITFGARGSALRGDTNVNGERILTLVDGQPFRSSISGIHNIRILYESFPVQAIERVELIRGPGSAIYGSNAVSGVVNIVTRHPHSNNTELSVKGGSNNTQQQQLFASYAKSPVNFSLALDNHKSDGWSSDVETTFNPGERAAYEKPTKHQSLISQLTYHGLSAKALWLDYNSNYVRPLEGVYEDNITAEKRFIDLGYEHSINEKWQIHSHWLHMRGTDTQYGGKERNNLLNVGIEGRLNNDGLKFISGVEWNSSEYSMSSPLVEDFDGESEFGSLFGQITAPLTRQYNAYIGAQYNKVKGGDSDLSPRVGLIYHNSDNQGIKLLYNQAFRTPKASETSLNILLPDLTTVVFVSDPDLKSTTVTTWDLQWFSYQERYHYSATLFSSHYQNRVEVDQTVFPISYDQQSNVDIVGLELEGRFTLNDHSAIDWYFTRQRNEGDNNVKDFTLAPNTTAAIGFNYQFTNHINIALFNQYISGFHSVISSPKNNPAPEKYYLLSGYCTIPLKSFADSIGIKQTSIAIYATNLLDEEIWQPELVAPQFNTIQTTGGREIYLSINASW